MRRLDASHAAGPEELLDALVTKRPNHGRIVARGATRNKLGLRYGSNDLPNRSILPETIVGGVAADPTFPRIQEQAGPESAGDPFADDTSGSKCPLLEGNMNVTICQ